ncbi:hypothetical protein LCGC14_1485730 [marine sediment metagenome]|uniref:Uncharacterized protein n=1 Tax=marine sediment metagenome TaxID=412755 RepID=A0A0F9JU30_9ZZZZ
MREYVVLTRVEGQESEQDLWGRGSKLESEGYFLLSTQVVRKGHGVRGEGPNIYVHTYYRNLLTLRETIGKAIESWDSYDINTTVKLFTKIVNAYHRETPDGEEG